MGIAKLFKDNNGPINAFDFHERGEYLVTSGDDEMIHLYQSEKGGKEKKIPSKKYGCELIKFTHNDKNVIVASKVNLPENNIVIV